MRALKFSIGATDFLKIHLIIEVTLEALTVFFNCDSIYIIPWDRVTLYMTEKSFLISLIKLHVLSKEFDGKTIISDLNLTISHSEFLTILDYSHCSKIIALRLIAGLETVVQGSILLDDQDITAIPTEQRHVNTVFQSYALCSCI